MLTNPYQPPASLPEVQATRSISEWIKDLVLVLEAIILLFLIGDDFFHGRLPIDSFYFFGFLWSVSSGVFVLVVVWLRSPWSNWFALLGIPSTWYLGVTLILVFAQEIDFSYERLLLSMLALFGSGFWGGRSFFLLKRRQSKAQ